MVCDEPLTLWPIRLPEMVPDGAVDLLNKGFASWFLSLDAAGAFRAEDPGETSLALSCGSERIIFQTLSSLWSRGRERLDTCLNKSIIATFWP